MKTGLETTEVIQDEKRIILTVMSLIAGARIRLDLSLSAVGPRTGVEFVEALRSAKKRGVRNRMVTEVGKENLEALLAASDYLEVRHISGLRGNSWAINDTEYLSSLAVGEFKATLPVVYSNAKSLVIEHQSIFDALWDHGETLEERKAFLESDTGLPEMEIIRDPARASQLYLSLARRAKNEVLLIHPTAAAFHRDESLGVVQALEERASKGVAVKFLVPVDREILARLGRQPISDQRISFRPVLRAEATDTVTVLVVDRSASLTIDERDPAEEVFEKAFGSALLATREPRVRQYIRLFDRIWRETELREVEVRARQREEASRKRAELMQDILTHDIRNFNQVARLNAELLAEELTAPGSRARTSAILRAVDGSTKLIERAKKLGSIISAKIVRLRPVSLKGALDRSVLLVRRGNPGVKLKVEGRLSGQALADELLDEVFVNVIMNSVKYRAGKVATVTVSQEPGELPGVPEGVPRPCWKILVSDRGRGIPDGLKVGIFRRYMETAKGSGLGLSIVYALANDRYGGRVALKNRVAGDYTKGTTVEIWLPKPRSPPGSIG